MGKRAKRQNALCRRKRRMEEIPLYPHELLRFSPLKSLANPSGFTKHPPVPVPVPTLRYRHGIRTSGSEVTKPSEGRAAHALLSAPGPARPGPGVRRFPLLRCSLRHILLFIPEGSVGVRRCLFLFGQALGRATAQQFQKKVWG